MASRPPPIACARPSPGPTFLRRLTDWEYDNTVADLLGYTGRASADFDLAPDARVGGFDDNAESIGISTPALERYQAAAEGITTKLTSSATALRAFVGCDPTTDACLATFVDRFGRRAFRRPLVAAERADLLALAATGVTAADRVSQVVRGILLAPTFLFRPETGEPDASHSGLVKLTGMEMATRLSFALLGTTPPDALLDRAAAGALDSADGVAATARQLIADQRAHTAIARFLGQWFQLDTLKGAAFDARKYPKWTAKLGDAMAEETARFLDAVSWSPGARALDLLDAPWSVVNADLAKHYGLPAPAEPWGRVTFAPGDQRGGLLTQASALTLTSKPDHASAILRGRFARETLLCTAVPPPPPNVPQLSDPIPGETERQRFERHTRDPVCAACHGLLDPIGFGLGAYDAIGAIRTVDDQRRPISTAGRIGGLMGPDVEFDGGVALGHALRALDDVPHCLGAHTLRYVLGRSERDEDACTLVTLAETARTGNFPDLVVALVTSDAFRYREPVAAQKAGAP